jgi:hypothetical protein
MCSGCRSITPDSQDDAVAEQDAKWRGAAAADSGRSMQVAEFDETGVAGMQASGSRNKSLPLVAWGGVRRRQCARARLRARRAQREAGRPARRGLASHGLLLSGLTSPGVGSALCEPRMGRPSADGSGAGEREDRLRALREARRGGGLRSLVRSCNRATDRCEPECQRSRAWRQPSAARAGASRAVSVYRIGSPR